MNSRIKKSIPKTRSSHRARRPSACLARRDQFTAEAELAAAAHAASLAFVDCRAEWGDDWGSVIDIKFTERPTTTAPPPRK